MKKIFIFVLLLLLVPAICLAEPQVTSDKQTFNPFTGVYDLQGNVHVEIGDRIITGDAAQVSMYKLEVHGQGNITLREGDITFDCDTVDVYGKEKTAYVAGNMNFTQGDMIISADTGSFNWSTKNADVKRINEELEYAKGIMRRLHCTIINVSNRAIEETAGMILEYVQKNKDRR